MHGCDVCRWEKSGKKPIGMLAPAPCGCKTAVERENKWRLTTFASVPKTYVKKGPKENILCGKAVILDDPHSILSKVKLESTPSQSSHDSFSEGAMKIINMPLSPHKKPRGRPRNKTT